MPRSPPAWWPRAIGSTRVTVLTDLNITGKPAQFGRGVMVDVGNKLIGQFADCLAGKLGGETASADQGDPAAEIAAGVQATADSSAPGTDPVAPTFTEPVLSTPEQAERAPSGPVASRALRGR